MARDLRHLLAYVAAAAASRRTAVAAAALVLFGLGLGLGWLGAVYLTREPTPGAVTAAPGVGRGNPMAWADPGAQARIAERTPRPPVAQAPEARSPGDRAATAPAARAARADGVPVPGPKPQARQRAGGFAHPEAEPVQLPAGAAKLAIVVDDLGLSDARSTRAIALPPAVTLSFLTYAQGLPELTRRARAAGHEILAHVPMQPRDAEWDAGRNALRTDLAEAALRRRLAWALDRFDGYVGINNHMGSAFTADRAAMRVVLATLRDRGLMFLDSRTTPESAGAAVSRQLGLAFAARDVFLDNAKDAAAIRASLRQAARIARETGAAVAIGHPYPVTFDVLEQWIPKARARGIRLVPISAVTAPLPAAPAQTAAREGADRR